LVPWRESKHSCMHSRLRQVDCFLALWWRRTASEGISRQFSSILVSYSVLLLYGELYGGTREDIR
jgi:hypothetical protein